MESITSFGFKTTWGWVNDDRIFIWVWTIPLMMKPGQPSYLTSQHSDIASHTHGAQCSSAHPRAIKPWQNTTLYAVHLHRTGRTHGAGSERWAGQSFNSSPCQTLGAYHWEKQSLCIDWPRVMAGETGKHEDALNRTPTSTISGAPSLICNEWAKVECIVSCH